MSTIDRLVRALFRVTPRRASGNVTVSVGPREIGHVSADSCESFIRDVAAPFERVCERAAADAVAEERRWVLSALRLAPSLEAAASVIRARGDDATRRRSQDGSPEAAWRAIVERMAAYPCATGCGDGVYEGLRGPPQACGCAPCDARALLAREVGS